MNRVRRTGRAISVFFSGAVGIGVFLVLAFLGVLGTILTATGLLRFDIDPAVLLGPSAIIVVSNVVYREVQRRRRAESELDQAKEALSAKPDERAILRLFLRLHDQGLTVLEPFHHVLEQLPRTMPEGEKKYAEWIGLCKGAIEEHRPAYALRFRQSLVVALANHTGMYVIVKDDEGSGKDAWVDMALVRRYDDLVRQTMVVLAEIIAAG